MSLKNFLYPKSIAIIGASSNQKKIGYQILDNISSGGFRGKIYPINLKGGKIKGLPVYRSVELIKAKVDLAIISIPASFVFQEIKKCSQAGIKNIVIISSGFAESGPMGKKLQAEINLFGKKAGINILGPNCLGFINNHIGLNASFAQTAGESGQASGVAILSQSGAIGSILLDKRGLGISYFLSLGNKADLGEAEFLDFFKKDKNVKLVLIYLEQLQQGEKFLRAVNELSRVKPVAVLRSGHSQAGQKAVFSHTGGLAGSSELWESILRQQGALVLNGLDDIVSLSRLFGSAEGLNNRSESLHILSNAGGPTILAVDYLADQGIVLKPWGTALKTKLKNSLPSLVQVHNPLDILGDADPDRYQASLNILLASPEVQNLMIFLTPQTSTDVPAIAQVVARAARKHRNKLLLPVFMGESSLAEAKSILSENGLPLFSSLDQALRAYSFLVKYKNNKNKIFPYHFFASATEVGGVNMDYLELAALLRKQAVPISPLARIRAKADLKNVKLPAALRVVGPKIVHKSDQGAIYAGLENRQELELAYKKLSKLLKDKDNYCLAQKMEAGVEMIVGFRRDPELGPVVLVGAGGIYTELLGDKAVARANLTLAEAKKMIKSLKIFPLLNGYRGQEKLDWTSLAKLMVKIARLASTNPEISELDINPVFVQTKGVKVVDFRALK